MSDIPDPTVDLDWSGYVGSIQEHFRAQAEAHPERTCVVETKSSTTPERIFTYRQIYEASNTLAWHLHKAGVTNGDVVMIWAHRSVDLVVALMGILVRQPTISLSYPLVIMLMSVSCQGLRRNHDGARPRVSPGPSTNLPRSLAASSSS